MEDVEVTDTFVSNIYHSSLGNEKNYCDSFAWFQYLLEMETCI